MFCVSRAVSGQRTRGSRKEYKVKDRTAVTDSFVRFAGGFRRAIGVIGLCFEEARPVVQGVFLLRLLAGAFFASSVLSFEAFGGGFAISLPSGAAVWICATSAAYIYNGVQDVEEDRANGSSRPVARGALSVSHATLAAGALGAIGLLGALLVHRELALGVAAMLTMGWLYSGPPLRLKRFPAALAAMAVASAVLTYYAGYTVGGGENGPVPLFVFAGIMALWMGLVGQTKDFSDVRGDERARRRSLPVVWGEETARLAVSGVTLALGAGFLLLGFLLERDLLLPAIIVFAGALAVSALLLGPWARGGRHELRRPYKAFMATQYAANLAVIFLPVGV